MLLRPIPGGKGGPSSAGVFIPPSNSRRAGRLPAGAGEDARQQGSLTGVAKLFDAGRIYERALARKQQKRWWNLEVDRAVVRNLLASDGWYDLLIPPEQLEVRSFADLQRLEELASDLILEYIERCWRRERSRWEEMRLRAVPFDEETTTTSGSTK